MTIPDVVLKIFAAQAEEAELLAELAYGCCAAKVKTDWEPKIKLAFILDNRVMLRSVASDFRTVNVAANMMESSLFDMLRAVSNGINVAPINLQITYPVNYYPQQADIEITFRPDEITDELKCQIMQKDGTYIASHSNNVSYCI